MSDQHLEAIAMAQRILDEYQSNLEETGQEDSAVENNQGDGATLGRMAASRYRKLVALARLVVESNDK